MFFLHSMVYFGLLLHSHPVGFFIFLVHRVVFRLRFVEGLRDFFEIESLRWLQKLALIRFIGYSSIAFGLFFLKEAELIILHFRLRGLTLFFRKYPIDMFFGCGQFLCKELSNG